MPPAASRELHLPLPSPLARGFGRGARRALLATVTLAALLGSLGPGAASHGALMGLALGFALPGALGYWLLRRGCAAAYVLDGKIRGVEYARTCMGREFRTAVCHRTEARAVLVQGRYQVATGWTYRVVLLRKDGRILPITGRAASFESAEAVAAECGRVLDLEHLAGRPQAVLLVTPGALGPAVELADRGERPGFDDRGIALVEEPVVLRTELALEEGLDVGVLALASLLPLTAWALPGALQGSVGALGLLLAALPAALLAPRPVEILRLLAAGASLPLRRLPDPARIESPFVLEFLALEEDQRTSLLEEVTGREVTCPYCRAALDPEQAVACLDCETLHHADCWREALECTTYACGGRRSARLVRETASSRK